MPHPRLILFTLGFAAGALLLGGWVALLEGVRSRAV